MQKMIGEQLVNYETLGAGKKNLIILHGWGGSLQEWLPVAKRLEISHKVWLLDFPGFGGSPKPSKDWNIYDYANSVRDFIKSENLKNIVVLGHSFGGRVGIVLASNFQSLVSNLLLVDVAGLEIKSWKALIFGTVADYFKWVPDNIRSLFRSPDFKSAGNMREIFIKVVNQDLSKEMSEIKCPTVIIWGENDRVLPISQAKKIKKLIRDSEIRVVWGADHWPHLSKPSEFMEILNEYI